MRGNLFRGAGDSGKCLFVRLRVFLPGDGVAVIDAEEDVDVVLVSLGGLFRER